MSVGKCEICYGAIDTESYHCKKCYNDFHFSCMEQSVAKSDTCPVCREPLEETDILVLGGSKDSTPNLEMFRGFLSLIVIGGIIITLMTIISSNVFR